MCSYSSFLIFFHNHERQLNEKEIPISLQLPVNYTLEFLCEECFITSIDWLCAIFEYLYLDKIDWGFRDRGDGDCRVKDSSGEDIVGGEEQSVLCWINEQSLLPI